MLHLKLPPEVRLSSARASLLRVTFVLDFGVPQISIEVHAVQVQASLNDDARSFATGQEKTHHVNGARSSCTGDDLETSYSGTQEHVPTVDDLANSFIREEPTDEIRELAQELESQPSYMQESIASTDDGEEESSAGVGAPLGLPAYLRNILNTALDRLSIVVNDIDVELQDQTSPEPSTSSKSSDSSPVSLNFHIEHVAIDSLTAEGPRIDVSSAQKPQNANAIAGKRRLRVQNICARLVSDAESFISASQISPPLSPETTRSEVSTEQNSYHEQPTSSVLSPNESQTLPLEVDDAPLVASGETTSVESSSLALETPAKKLENELIKPLVQSSQTKERSPASPFDEQAPLAASLATVDDDRFADAFSDDGLENSRHDDILGHNLHSPSAGLSGSSLLYNEGILDYALQNSQFDLEDDPHAQVRSLEESHLLKSDVEAELSPSASEASSTSAWPTVSGLGLSFTQSDKVASLPHSTSHDMLQASADQSGFDAHPLEDEAKQSIDDVEAPGFTEAAPEMTTSVSSSDASDSMYMSAISAAPTETSQRQLPGAWDSSSTSSRGTTSDQSGPVPEEMISGSILQPRTEAEDGCDTPRPGSRQSAATTAPHSTGPSPHTAEASTARKQTKVFLTVDEITIWFPLEFDDERTTDSGTNAESAVDASTLGFAPTRLGEDSIFAEMPGSFSNYAHSTSTRRPGSMVESLRRPTASKTSSSQPAQRPAKTPPKPDIVVDVGTVVGHVDLPTGRIMFNMLTRVLGALTDGDERERPSPSPAATVRKAASVVELTVRHVGVAWLENILPESMTCDFAAGQMLRLKPVDALLGVNLSTLRLTSRSDAATTLTKLQIEKLAFSSLGADIISFHTHTRSRRSISNLSEQLSHDIEIDYEKGSDKRVTIVTRPVKVNFDIQQLDDALSSFGGFSGVLELGNSISSNNALNSPVLTPAKPKPRGVHFGDSPPVTEASAQITNMPKIQVQIGEVLFLLKGRSCAVQLQTTTVRIAVRQSNVRLKVSEAQLSGPYLNVEQKGAPWMVDVHGTTVNFLYTPEEADLTRLISLITPSKDPYENNDDILIDTFLRQRRKGSVLRVEVNSIGVRLSDLEEMGALQALGVELARLSKVTKYLPEDDRPGLLTLASIQQFNAGVTLNERLGDITIAANNTSVAHVGFPALFALEVGTVLLKRDQEILMHEVIKLKPQELLPMIMVRMVGDEMEPVVKAKLFNVCIEYRVSTVMAALGISEDGTVEDIAAGIASSVATITRSKSPQPPISRQSSGSSTSSSQAAKPLQIDLLLRSCAIGLNPRSAVSKGLFVFTEAHFAGKQVKKDYSIQLDLRKASIHAIDDITRLDEEPEESVPRSTSRHLQELSQMGFVTLSSISAAKVLADITGDGSTAPQLISVEFKNELLVLESCADSTQTLIEVLNGLQPPIPPSTAERYRTVVPLQEMMESFTGDAVPAQSGNDSDDFMSNADLVDDEVPTNLEFVGSIYSQDLPTNEDLGDSMLSQDDLSALATSPSIRERGDRGLLESFQEQYEVNKGEDGFDFSTDYFHDSDSERKGKARKWDSTQNQYHLTNEFRTPDAPLKVTVRDVNVIWNLYDGYDWPRTRAIISQAVDDVEARAEERRRRPRDEDEDDDFVEEDFLFNSVWIGVPIKEEKGALARRINHDIDDLASETGSYATSTATRSTGATARPCSMTKPGRRRLKLERSKHKKIAFSLMGVAVDLVVFPPASGETLNSVDVRVRDFEIFDHVPTSTWKKFVTCNIAPTQRESDRPMINLNLLTVKPVTDLAASELVIRVRGSVAFSLQHTDSPRSLSFRCVFTLTKTRLTSLHASSSSRTIQ